MAKVGIIYGTTEGVTETICMKVQKQLGGKEVAKLKNIESASKEDFEGHELQEDWEEYIDVLDGLDLNGKKVTFIGLGDADGYPDTFVDAIGLLYDKIKDSGAEFVGKWPTDDYTYDESKGEIDGMFLGLVIDNDNEPELNNQRVDAWTEQLKGELGL